MDKENGEKLDTIQVLRNLELPQKPVTDRFGFFRDWAKEGERDPETNRFGWNPDSLYRPIHYGIDYSWRTDRHLYAPGDGMLKYDYPFRMAIFIPTIGDDPVQDMAIYYRHVTAPRHDWVSVRKGEMIAMPDDDYPHPHLHMEMAVTCMLYRKLHKIGRLRGVTVLWHDWTVKARDRELVWDNVMKRIVDQELRDGILVQERDTIFRNVLPSYKRTYYGDLGQEEVAIIDPTKVLKHAN